MGYKILKRVDKKIADECIRVSKQKICFSSMLVKKLGLDKRDYRVIFMKETQSNKLCFDIKDSMIPDSFPIHPQRNSYFIYAQAYIAHHKIPTGVYYIESQDGSVYITNCVL